mgnify:CR=1 FL=1
MQESLFYGLSVVLGLTSEFVEVNYSSFLGSSLLLLIFTFLLGFSNSEMVWRWGLVAGVWIPIFNVLKLVLILENYNLVSLFAPFLVLIPSFAGAYMGAVLKDSSSNTNKKNIKRR